MTLTPDAPPVAQDPAPARPAGPRYRRMAETLQARIAAGDWKVGEALPTEQELCAEFAVSRHTAREALRVLAQAGLVRRRQGSGTEVIADAPPAHYRHAMRSLGELLDYAADTRLDLAPSRGDPLALAPPGLTLAPEAGPWLALEGVRRTKAGGAINYTRIWIPGAYRDILPDLAGRTRPVYDLIESRFGARVVEVAQEMSGATLCPRSAEALGRDPSEAAILLLRTYLAEGDRPVVVSASWHPADTFSYAMRLRREEAGG